MFHFSPLAVKHVLTRLYRFVLLINYLQISYVFDLGVKQALDLSRHLTDILLYNLYWYIQKNYDTLTSAGRTVAVT